MYCKQKGGLDDYHYFLVQTSNIFRTWKQFLASWSFEGAASNRPAPTEQSREEKSRFDVNEGRVDKATASMYSETKLSM